jgi:hypothetical protein
MAFMARDYAGGARPGRDRRVAELRPALSHGCHRSIKNP